MSESIDPGEMRTGVAYEAMEVVGRDRNGGEKLEPVEKWRGMAAIRPLSSKELVVAAGLKSSATHRVAIRWRPGVSLKGRFRVLGTARILEITSALNLEDRNVWLVCQAVEKTG